MSFAPKSMIQLYGLGGLVVALAACRAIDRSPSQHSSIDEQNAPQNVRIEQILPAQTTTRYKAALPKVAYSKLATILEDPDLFWYDHEVMPPSYQDTVAPDVTVGCRPNNEGLRLIDAIPGGAEIFSDDGETFRFPFGHTAGADNSTNTHIVDFMWLPKVDGKRLPVTYYIKEGTRSAFGLRQWRWMFPKGTVFGEMIFIKDQSNNLYPVELRTRERYLNGWATNSFRPFPTAQSLASAIKAKRPDWSNNPALTKAIHHLEDKETITPKQVSSSVFKDVFTEKGAIDMIPDLGDHALVKQLLTETPFVSAYGSVWKSANGLKTFAPKTNSRFSIVPDQFESGLIEVRDQSCQRCHQDAQRPIMDFNPDAVLYGDIWGSDQIFSFHVFDPELCHGAAEDNRALRPTFKESGMVQLYDTSVHTSKFYKELP